MKYKITNSNGEVVEIHASLSIARARKTELHNQDGASYSIQPEEYGEQLELPLGITADSLRRDPRFEMVKRSYRSGYVPKDSPGVVIPYEGRYGKGYIIKLPRWDSNRYCTYEYYIERASLDERRCARQVRRGSRYYCTAAPAIMHIGSRACTDEKPCYREESRGVDND
jgi:hypothetical protein